MNDESESEKSKKQDELSDYIDENFELDETDELWGIKKMNNYH